MRTQSRPARATELKYVGQRSDGGRCAAAIGGRANCVERWHEFGGRREMPALRGGNKWPYDRSRTAGGQRGAESAQFFGSVVRAEIVERCMKVSRCRQYPQAQRGRQHEAEAALQPMNGGQATHDGMRPGLGNECTISQGTVLIARGCPWKRPWRWGGGARRACSVHPARSDKNTTAAAHANGYPRQCSLCSLAALIASASSAAVPQRRLPPAVARGCFPAQH